MTHVDIPHSRAWYRSRVRRHSGEIFRLAWPAILSRMGAIALATVDTIMVGQYSTRELAYLNLGTGTFVMVALVMAFGLLLGSLVYAADEYGKGNFEACGQVWRRSLPYAAGIGLICVLICLPSESLFLWMGQTPEMAREGGRVMTIQGFGLFSHLIYFACIAFLEGIERTKIPMYSMLIANVINVFLNYSLIYGAWGLPELGAEGSAWATTILRTLLAIGTVIYILKAPSMQKFGVHKPWRGTWKSWHNQRVMGYASSLSLGAEVAAFGFLYIFAGWMGTAPVAAWGVVVNIISMMFMLSAGIGTAASVRVGIANSRKDRDDVQIAGWTSMGLNTIGMIALGLLVYLFRHEVAGFYTDDAALITIIMPVMLLVPFAMPFDGGQNVISNALRGLGQTWVPTGIQSFSYLIVMLPVSYWLGIILDMQVMGLMISVWAGGVVSLFLLMIWFHITSHRVGQDHHKEGAIYHHEGSKD